MKRFFSYVILVVFAFVGCSLELPQSISVKTKAEYNFSIGKISAAFSEFFSVSEITDKEVVIKTKDGKEEKIKADSVILSVGYKPSPIANKAKNIHVIGDANAVGNLRTVIWGTWDVCMKI